MKLNSKLIEILLSFSVEDWNRFEEFILKNDTVSRRKYFTLFSEFRKHLENKKCPVSVSTEELVKGAFGKTDYCTQSVYNRQSELLKLCTAFLIEQSIYKHEFMGDLLLSSELVNRKLIKNYESFSSKIQMILESNLYNEEAYQYLKDFSLDVATYFQIKEQVSKTFEYYKKYSDFLLADALNNIIQAQTELLMLKRTHNLKPDNMYFADTLNALESSGFFKEIEYGNNRSLIFSLIRFYIYKSISGDCFDDSISSAERIFFSNEEHFSKEFKMEIYRKLISSYVHKINLGEGKYIKDIYRIIKRKLKKNLTDDIKRETGYNIFREYVIYGIKLEKYKWVEQIIKKYSHIIPETIRNYEITVAFIRLYFARKEYGKILELTRNLKIQNILYYADMAVYRLMTLYEIKEYEQCYNEIASIRKHMKNKEDYMGIISATNLFLKAYKIILKNTNNPDLDRGYVRHLIDKIHRNYMRKDWIKEKVEQLS